MGGGGSGLGALGVGGSQEERKGMLRKTTRGEGGLSADMEGPGEHEVVTTREG